MNVDAEVTDFFKSGRFCGEFGHFDETIFKSNTSTAEGAIIEVTSEMRKCRFCMRTIGWTKETQKWEEMSK